MTHMNQFISKQVKELKFGIILVYTVNNNDYCRIKSLTVFRNHEIKFNTLIIFLFLSTPFKPFKTSSRYSLTLASKQTFLFVPLFHSQVPELLCHQVQSHRCDSRPVGGAALPRRRPEPAGGRVGRDGPQRRQLGLHGSGTLTQQRHRWWHCTTAPPPDWVSARQPCRAGPRLKVAPPRRRGGGQDDTYCRFDAQDIVVFIGASLQ